jgi:glutamyl-tRNA(Gln) amidotransferase subunit D
MGEDQLPGYRGQLRVALEGVGLSVGDLLRIVSDDATYEGSLMPRLETEDEWHIVLKQKSGYNIGIKYGESTGITRLGAAVKPVFRPPKIPDMKHSLPKVSIISTGGTIASRVDYVTGGVHAAMSSSDLLSIVPELSDIASLEADILYSVFSEAIKSEHWSGMAEKVEEKVKQGVDGVLITHGTDTMSYSAAALSFALKNIPIPVIFVGSQRSSDRPSSDSATNLLGVVSAAAYAPLAGVYLGMHETTSDTSILLHRGTKVRKCHTSARYAFQSVNTGPVARVVNGKTEILREDYRRRGEGTLEVNSCFEERVSLLKFHPGLAPGVIDYLVDSGIKGIVFEGTGLGHVGSYLNDSVTRASEHGVLMAMTSQCIWGRTDMDVYTTGRELQKMGVQPLGDMLPETALVKMKWALGNSQNNEEARRIMEQNIAGEYSNRTLYTGGAS